MVSACALACSFLFSRPHSNQSGFASVYAPTVRPSPRIVSPTALKRYHLQHYASDVYVTNHIVNPAESCARGSKITSADVKLQMSHDTSR